MPSISLSSAAYLKLYFHAAKHPHQSINGVLLGRSTGTNPLVVDDAIPLLHHWTNLSPMMEIGLDLAEQYANEAGLKVVGYYSARAAVGDGGLGPVGETIAMRVLDKFPNALAITIDGEDFGGDEIALNVWTYKDNQWKRITTSNPVELSSPDLPHKALGYVRDDGLHLQFGDFDDHLEDVKIVDTVELYGATVQMKDRRLHFKSHRRAQS